MSYLKTKKGTESFKVLVEIEEAQIAKQDDAFVAVYDGTQIPGVVIKAFVGKKEVALDSLVGDIDPTTLIGKDPSKMTVDEIAALQAYLADLAKGNAGVKDTEETKKEVKKSAEKKTGKKAPKEEPAEDTPAELPEGITSIEDLKGMSAKDLWKDVVKPLADELDGINSRSKKDDMIEALAAYFNLEDEEAEEEDVETEEDENEAEYEEDDAEDDDEYEDDEDEDEEEEEDSDEDEDEEEDDSEDDEDEEEDEEESDDDDDDEDEDEDAEWDDEEDDEDEDEVTEEDVDNLFKAGNKAAIIKFCKEHGISLPKKKLSAPKVKAIIKEALFGDE